MRETTIKVRLTVDEREAAELRAVELGYENFSQFVRAALRGSATSSALPTPGGIEPAAASTSSSSAAVVEASPDQQPWTQGSRCSRSARHRQGVRCGYCGATP